MNLLVFVKNLWCLFMVFELRLQGEHDKAVSFFEQAFELARSVGDRKLLDAARINLGMAKGNLAMGNYMGVVKSDLPALINWKTRRINF